MAENNLNTRIQLLYDTYTNWSTKNPKLKKGEMVQVEVPTAVGDVTQVPSILIKTGDGEHNFNDLPWTSGLAADVYDWAKAKEAPKSTWYVNITGTSGAPTGDKTPAEIYQAYTDGYMVYAVVQMTDLFNEMPFILPLVSIVPTSGSYLVAFSASAEPHKANDEALSITVTWNQKWYLFATVLAKKADISSILPAMSSDTKGKMLTNDGEKAEWGGAVRYDVAQNMNGNEQLQARKNIGAFPGKELRYFFDTTTGSAHDNDIIGANNGDVISPGNIYTDGDITNKDMVFPAYVLSVYYPTQSSSAYYVRLLDANGIGWQVLVGHDSESGNPIIREITSKNMSDVMCVNFTKDTNDNWLADKNWDDVAALIEAGGYVYARVNELVVPVVSYAAGQRIVFHISLHNTSAVGFDAVIWKQDGTISVLEDIIPIVMFGEQTLTTDQQAQARKNIGAVSSSDIKFVYAIGKENTLSLNDGNVYYIIEENVPLYLVSTANEYGGTTYTFCGFIYSANNQARILSKSYNTKGGWYTIVNTYDIPVGSTASLISDDDVDSVKIPYVEAVVNYVGNTTLKKTNTTEFTPTSDYQPATKKYVDDATASVPTKTSELTNDSNYITSSYVDTKVASLIDSAPETLDTLKELSAALGDDPNFATTISNQIGNKADKAQVLNITLAPASWTTSGNEFKYTYSNTSLRALASPIITCTSNTSEYKYITDAEATANTGIIFTAKTKPTNNIVLQIIDLG